MGLFSKMNAEIINATIQKSQQAAVAAPKTNVKSINDELTAISESVIEYFKDSKAVLLNDINELHDYITRLIDYGIAAIDTETTGLDRLHDTIVGASLYYPNEPEVYIPCNHLVPIFNEPYKHQITYEQLGAELNRLVTAKTKLVFANADFDLAMIYKDLHADLIDNFYYDVIIAWRCIKEDERENALKKLYAKYVLKDKAEGKKFSDFFTPQLFPYCKPEVAKLYAASDALFTFELFRWQMQYLDKNNPKCQRKHLEAISDLIFNVEFPMTKICQLMHRRGIYLEKSMAETLQRKYGPESDHEHEKLRDMVADLLNDTKYYTKARCPFATAKDFNPNSVPHVKWLLYDYMQLGDAKICGTGKDLLATFNLPITNQILKCRSLVTLIGTFVDKLPKSTSSDSRIHCQFKQIGANTGRMSSADPNMQNVPSHATDIRHMFRATPGYVLLSSDYS